MLKQKQQNASVEQPSTADQSQQPTKKGFWSRQVDKVKQVAQDFQQKAQNVNLNAQDIKRTAEQKLAKFKKVQLVFSVLSTLFFIGNSLFWVFDRWGEFGSLLWVMLGATLGYVLAFVITLVTHRKNAQQMQTDTKRFKIHLKLYKTLANVLFVVLSAIVLYQNLTAWRAEGGLFALLSMIVSGVLLVIKLLSAIISIITLNAKRKKLNKKEKKLRAQQQQMTDSQK